MARPSLENACALVRARQLKYHSHGDDAHATPFARPHVTWDTDSFKLEDRERTSCVYSQSSGGERC